MASFEIIGTASCSHQYLNVNGLMEGAIRHGSIFHLFLCIVGGEGCAIPAPKLAGSNTGADASTEGGTVRRALIGDRGTRLDRCAPKPQRRIGSGLRAHPAPQRAFDISWPRGLDSSAKSFDRRTLSWSPRPVGVVAAVPPVAYGIDQLSESRAGQCIAPAAFVPRR